ncbi:hypothetical protein BD779DRAFT_1474763 [Infundibulicybe gibba]|nr:hypothetical protein BD779DRAFT_1474763 [Infundibulicybe gibba]
MCYVLRMVKRGGGGACLRQVERRGGGSAFVSSQKRGGRGVCLRQVERRSGGSMFVQSKNAVAEACWNPAKGAVAGAPPRPIKNAMVAACLRPIRYTAGVNFMPESGNVAGVRAHVVSGGPFLLAEEDGTGRDGEWTRSCPAQRIRARESLSACIDEFHFLHTLRLCRWERRTWDASSVYCRRGQEEL